ncbi:hypothetical protein CTAYLR_000570 [Chrysophaeum taylorii]|uniref:ADP-ribosylation factor n=1 Tax=Chrysophaeum taylorii TaxID=2483200 RepID=A0AAD7UGY9_9STRA|nr:hypothetical protein CTAYLR_000570 [Chrysophaeum taylorii]
MGILFSIFSRRMYIILEGRLLMLGLDAVGKTIILYKLKLGEVVSTIPTINVERLTYKGIELTVWEIGGQDKIRQLWLHYLTDTHGLIFVVDSNDQTRLDDARYELHKLLHQGTNFATTPASSCTFISKQDLPHALSATNLAAKLDFASLRTRKWYVQACAATTGVGLYEGMDWNGQGARGDV